MLVNATEMLKKAYENGYAIGHFNTNNLEWTKAILQAAQEKNTAVMIAASAVSYTHLTLPTKA